MQDTADPAGWDRGTCREVAVRFLDHGHLVGPSQAFLADIDVSERDGRPPESGGHETV
jgi:hypothetical protein